MPFVVAAAILTPVLVTGFYGDDASDANLNAALDYRPTSLAGAVATTAALWMRANGRLFPLYVLEKYVVFHLLADPRAYKIFLFVLTLAALAAFFALIRGLAGPAVAAVASLFVALGLQMRGYHDALYSYNGMVQIMLLALFASLWCWRRYLTHGERVFGAAALLLYAANGLTYEFSYLFFVLYGFMAAKQGVRDLVRATAPFAAMTGLLVAISFVLRLHATNVDGAYVVGTDPIRYIATLAKQLTAAVPLSYFAWNPSRIFPPLGNVFDRSSTYAVGLGAAGVFAFAALAVLAGLRRPNGGEGRLTATQLFALGVGLWLLPAPIVAASAKYQRELVWGIGYLPVLIECFGVALLAALALHALIARLSQVTAVGLVLVCALFCGFAGAVTLADNRRLALELEPWRDSRDVVAVALRRGVLSGLPPNAALHLAGPLPWVCYAGAGCPDDLDVRYFVFGNSGHRVDAVADAHAAYILRYGVLPRLAWVSVSHSRGDGALVYVQVRPGAGCVLTIAAPQPTSATWATVVDQGQGWVLGRTLGEPKTLPTECGTLPLFGS